MRNAVPSTCSPSGSVCARLLCKGAAEIVLQRCGSRIGESGAVQRLGAEEADAILHSFSEGGYRCGLKWCCARVSA
jgi:magnesium-transporting ATPase (P-type)